MGLVHLTYSSDGRHPLCPTERSRRLAVRALARTVGGHTVLFCVVDDHLHLVLICLANQVRRLGQPLLFALRRISAVHISSPHVEPVRSRSHMTWLADQYLIWAVREARPAAQPGDGHRLLLS